MRPVLILPVRNLTVLAHGIGPVVPSLATRRLVEVAILLMKLSHEGQNVVVEDIDGLVAGHHSVKVARHVLALHRSASIDKASHVEVAVCVLKTVRECEGHMLARVLVINRLDDICDKLKIFAGQCPLLLLGHFNCKHRSSRVKGVVQKSCNYLQSLRVLQM